MTTEAEVAGEGEATERPIGLPESLRGEAGGANPSAVPPPAGLDVVPAPPPPAETEALPLWAVVFLAGFAALTAVWLAVMAVYALRVLGWP